MIDDVKTDWQRVLLPGDKQSDLYIEVAVRGGRETVGLLDFIPIDHVCALLADVANAVGNALAKASPSKATVELGVEFGMQEGKLVALIARGGGKANLKIGLEWNSSPAGIVGGRFFSRRVRSCSMTSCVTFVRAASRSWENGRAVASL